MIVVAGPPGSGKSSAFPVRDEGVDFFNADDRAAELNNGSYRNISEQIRARVNDEFEAFVIGHIDRQESFAIETTLRSDITFRQASLARDKGFRTTMVYVALDDFRRNVERVKARADAGGHSASELKLRKIYLNSLANLSRALQQIDSVRIYDNSRLGLEPELLMETERGDVVFLAENIPEWLRQALAGTAHEIVSGTQSA